MFSYFYTITTAKGCLFRYIPAPWGRFHRLPFGPSLHYGDARTVPMAPLIAKFRCSTTIKYKFHITKFL